MAVKVKFDAALVRRIRSQTSVGETSRIAARALDNPHDLTADEIKKLAASCLSKVLLIQSAKGERNKSP
jgi:phage-related minor tail protein